MITHYDFCIASLDNPQIIQLVNHHHKKCQQGDPLACHPLSIDDFKNQQTTLWSLTEGHQSVAIGAIKCLDHHHGEIKTLYVPPEHRGKGLGKMMLQDLIKQAKKQNLQRLSLETGISEYFAPAFNLYKNLGFTHCAPFSTYQEHPESIYLTLTLISS